ncbi:hypothetical protein ACWGN5_12615 [Streptomyces sp. NPDC055815]
MSELQERDGRTVLSRRRRAAAVIAAVVVLAGGGLYWWASGDSEVEVPDRICGGALPGSGAAILLPQEGAQYEERSDNDFGAEKPGDIWCHADAGGQSLLFSYWWSVSDLGSALAENPGNTPMQLGQAKGYTSEDDAEIYVSCRGRSDEGEWIKVRLARGAWDRSTPGEQDRVRLAELVGDATRYVARELGCEGAAKLPGGAPAIG